MVMRTTTSEIHRNALTALVTIDGIWRKKQQMTERKHYDDEDNSAAAVCVASVEAVHDRELSAGGIAKGVNS